MNEWNEKMRKLKNLDVNTDINSLVLTIMNLLLKKKELHKLLCQ